MANYQWRFTVEISAKNETEAEDLIYRKMQELFSNDGLVDRRQVFRNLRRLNVEMEGA